MESLADEGDEMTDEDLAAARALVDAATPGPWRFELGSFDGGGGHIMTASPTTESWTKSPILVSHYFYANDAADFELMAAAPTLVPALLDEVERLREAHNPLRVLSESEIQDALHQGRAEAMASQGDNAWSSLLRQRDEARAEVERLRAELANVLASAVPNKRDHPSMFAAWKRAETLLSGEGDE